MSMRQCKSCNKKMPLNGEYFPRNFSKKLNKYHYRGICKICYNAAKREERKKNGYPKKYYEKNKARILALMKSKNYYQKPKQKDNSKDELMIKELEYQLNYYKKKLNENKK